MVVLTLSLKEYLNYCMLYEDFLTYQGEYLAPNFVLIIIEYVQHKIGKGREITQ